MDNNRITIKNVKDEATLLKKSIDIFFLRILGTLFKQGPIMEKIKNGDQVIYKDRKGIIYGKPRENKYRGVLYTVKIGDDYVKATPSEISLEKESNVLAPLS
jgi:hypothetical protein